MAVASPAVSQPQPLVGTPATTPGQAATASYRFFKTADSGAPGAYWNPCSDIEWGIDLTYARKAGLRGSWEIQRWKSAIAEVSAVMGVRFTYVGQTRTRSDGKEPLGGPELVITYGRESAGGPYGYGRTLQGTAAGISGVSWRSMPGTNRSEVFRGYVVIDAQEIIGRVTRPDSRPADQRGQDLVRALYLHEFGHAVGLDHVDDRSQLMFPQLITGVPDTFGPGDRKALKALGSQRCF